MNNETTRAYARSERAAIAEPALAMSRRRASLQYRAPVSVFNLILIVSCIALAPASRASEVFFHTCVDVLATPSFAPLHNFYLSNPDQPAPDSCSRLNDTEFLVTVTNTGPIAQGLYFFDAKQAIYRFPDGAYREGIKVETEFVGPNHKRFVLLSESFLKNGTWTETYELLYLVPGKGDRSFQLQRLFSVAQDSEQGLCRSGHSSGVASAVSGYKVAADGTQHTKLIFNLEAQDCSTKAKHNYEKIFEAKDVGFGEIPASAAPVQFRISLWTAPGSSVPNTVRASSRSPGSLQTSIIALSPTRWTLFK
jgi:hypothetical protein